MQKFIFTLVVLASISMSSHLMAQGPGGRGGDGGRGGQRGGDGGAGGGGYGGQRGGGPRPVSPMMTALDVDKDGKLSAEEIANAAVALKALDKNSDGVLDATELAPARPERGGRGGDGGGGRGGRGGRGGGGDPSAFIDRMMERDTNKDGMISKEEGGERMSRFFDMMDGDADGNLTKEELETAAKRFQGGGGRGGRGGGGGRGQQPKSKESRPAFDDK